MTRPIDADALHALFDEQCASECAICTFYEKSKGNLYCGLIDNAPTIPLPDFKEGYKQAIVDGKTNFSRGECKSCRHRDPEDKKCDCGALERQGCYFPVSDDYYCKYYEEVKHD